LSPIESFLERMSKTKKAWKKFIDTDEINALVVRPIIADSWKRCKSAKVDPYSKRPINPLNSKEINILLERNTENDRRNDKGFGVQGRFS